MRAGPCVAQAVAITLCLGSSPLMAQAPVQAYALRTYECAANAHCAVSCQIDGEKQMRTAAKTVTVTPIAPNDYVVELVEQNGTFNLFIWPGRRLCAI